MNKSKIIQMVAALAAILVIVGSLRKLVDIDSMTLSEYATLNASPNPSGSQPPRDGADALTPSPSAAPASASSSPGTAPIGDADAPDSTASAIPGPVSALTGGALNGSSQLRARTTYTEGFYYEPLSDNLRRYMLGVSYPTGELSGTKTEIQSQQEISQPGTQQTVLPTDLDSLCYVHIWHYDFSGTPREGELICNEYIAQDLLEIFYELYRNEYQLEKVLLIDEYDGDAEAAREDNNSFCFYYAPSGMDSASAKHALGLALDINPHYNPRISYEEDGSQTITPASAADYADRTGSFPYKIDEDDLCCKLFLRYGFTWGGNRNDGKDYQHFQKAL